jgi:AraC family transcriptional regulator of adaptative response/methylated-DNA-[protein]-cysteine methyltransferase
MARLNDNLFTTLVAHAVPSELGCLLLTRLGWVRVRFTERGLAELFFVDKKPSKLLVDSVFREAFLEWVAQFQQVAAAAKWRYLDLTGTDFQKSVWQRLLEIPFGGRTSYGQIAAELGQPQASRAVGSAVGANPVSLLVPCHRVLPSTGRSGNYRWGADRKLALLDAEQRSDSDLCSLFI